MQNGIWILALILTVWAGVIDWRSRRIPNWLTVPALFVGIGVNTISFGWDGAKASLAGAGLALALLLPFVVLRGLGAGDWKLFGALGAFLGPAPTLVVLFFSTLIAGVMAVALSLARNRLRTTLANTWELVRGFVTFGFRPHPVITLDNPKALSLPFGVAVGVATISIYGARLILGIL